MYWTTPGWRWSIKVISRRLRSKTVWMNFTGFGSFSWQSYLRRDWQQNDIQRSLRSFGKILKKLMRNTHKLWKKKKKRIRREWMIGSIWLWIFPDLWIYPIFPEMKSSLKLVVVFELSEVMVGFEYIHSSFPDRKRSPEYQIFSEMKSSLKLVVSEAVVGFEYIHSSFPNQKRSPEYPIFSEMKSSLNSSKAWLALNTFTLHFPIENILQSIKSSLNSSKEWLALNTFTLHFWNEVFSETCGRLLVRPTFDFPDQLEFFKLFKVVIIFKLFDQPSTFRIGIFLVFKLFNRPSTFRIGIFLVFSETRGRLWTVRPAFDFPDWNFFSLRTVRPAFDFPDRLEFFSSSKACSSSTQRWKERLIFLMVEPSPQF